MRSSCPSPACSGMRTFDTSSSGGSCSGSSCYYGPQGFSTAVLLVFVRVVSAYHRRRARHRGIAGGQTGAVTAIERLARPLECDCRGVQRSGDVA